MYVYLWQLVECAAVVVERALLEAAHGEHVGEVHHVVVGHDLQQARERGGDLGRGEG